MFQKSRFANLLIDTVGRLSDAGTAAARWQEIVAIAGGLGANGVVAAAISRQTRLPVWASYDLEAAWLDEYEEARLHEVDPVLWAQMVGSVPKVLETGTFRMDRSEDPRRIQFNAGARRNSYNYCICLTQRGGALEKNLTLLSDADPTDLFGRGTAQAFQAISSVMIDFLDPPGEVQSLLPLGMGPERLSGPERDILSLMAHGMAQEEISRRLHISPERLRVLLQQSMRKMGAANGSQAMATAMARGLLSL